jgi:predicted RNA-binding Zn-ribbon protein involved in translation (DUF1610 family)
LKFDLRRAVTASKLLAIDGALRNAWTANAMWEKFGMIDIVSTLPSMTATWAVCPQCGRSAWIKSIAPHPGSEKEDHTFECEECGLPRTYTMDTN